MSLIIVHISWWARPLVFSRVCAAWLLNYSAVGSGGGRGVVERRPLINYSQGPLKGEGSPDHREGQRTSLFPLVHSSIMRGFVKYMKTIIIMRRNMTENALWNSPGSTMFVYQQQVYFILDFQICELVKIYFCLPCFWLYDVRVGKSPKQISCQVSKLLFWFECSEPGIHWFLKVRMSFMKKSFFCILLEFDYKRFIPDELQSCFCDALCPQLLLSTCHRLASLGGC